MDDCVRWRGIYFNIGGMILYSSCWKCVLFTLVYNDYQSPTVFPRYSHWNYAELWQQGVEIFTIRTFYERKLIRNDSHDHLAKIFRTKLQDHPQKGINYRSEENELQYERKINLFCNNSWVSNFLQHWTTGWSFFWLCARKKAAWFACEKGRKVISQRVIKIIRKVILPFAVQEMNNSIEILLRQIL